VLISKWDQRFMERAEQIASWSKDPSTHVGAVITQGKRVVSEGYNGLPQLVEDSPERLNDREVKLALTIHAEINAILFAKQDITGCTIYVWPLPPCAACMSVIIQAGIKRVVTVKSKNKFLQKRWESSNNLALEVAHEVGIPVVYLEAI